MPELPREQPPLPEQKHQTLSDETFRRSIASLEDFRKYCHNRPVIRGLEQTRHQAAGQSVFEHTQSVLLYLRTDELRNIKLGDMTISTPDLMRKVALYHDVEKILEGGRTKIIGKRRAADDAIREIKSVDSGFFQTAEDEKVFRVLLETCDYFGYHIALLDRQGTSNRDALKQLLEKKLIEPLEALEQEGIEIDYEDFLRIQYEISRADTMGIEPFRRNVGSVDRLFEALNDAFAY
ncbi:hypothetical protein EPN81_03360 [Patescibacteria group bacterium]|nr:MAG: hypothetical protein EPN81_03360 [Patescibacteria group bacterium]